MRNDRKKRNRFGVLIITLMIILDYLMICFQIERNPFAIFPPFPVRDSREEVTVFLPDVDGNTILKETRMVDRSGTDENFIKYLMYIITRGSKYENTRLAVPIDAIVRAVWIENSICIIDIRMEALPKDVPIIKGTEANFREAVKKTVMANFEGIQDVILVENGIYNRNMWELSHFEETSEM